MVGTDSVELHPQQGYVVPEVAPPQPVQCYAVLREGTFARADPRRIIEELQCPIGVSATLMKVQRSTVAPQ